MKTKEQKRSEAQKRQLVHDACTPEQQLALLDYRGMEAVRERGKLAYEILKRQMKEGLS